MMKEIQVTEKPDWVSWDEIHKTLWEAHEQNRKRGINMAYPSLPGEKIREMIEGNGKMYIALDGTKVIGTAGITPVKRNLWCGKGEYAYCCFASVLPDYNGMGIYKQFCLVREEAAKELGIDCLLFDTNKHNAHVININNKNVFKTVDLKILKDHHNVVMVKWLNGCPYSDFHCQLQFTLRRLFKIVICKISKLKRLDK